MMLGSASHTIKHQQQQQQRGDHVALQGIALGSAHCRKYKRSLSWRNKRLSSIMSWFSSVLGQRMLCLCLGLCSPYTRTSYAIYECSFIKMFVLVRD